MEEVCGVEKGALQKDKDLDLEVKQNKPQDKK